MKINSIELRSFFYGTLLGDSYIHNNVFYCKQINKDLIDFKRKIIEKNIPDARVLVREYKEFTDKNGVHHQKYYQLEAKGEYIKKLQRLFYPNGIKIIPKGIIEKLTPLGLAMWYADDGTTILVGKQKNGSAKARRVQICTDCFTVDEINMAIEEFKKIHLNVFKIKRKENVYRISLKSLESQKFMLQIANYFYYYFPSLLYKIDLGYRNDSLNKRSYVLYEYSNLYIKISAHPDFKDRLLNR